MLSKDHIMLAEDKVVTDAARSFRQVLNQHPPCAGPEPSRPPHPSIHPSGPCTPAHLEKDGQNTDQGYVSWLHTVSKPSGETDSWTSGGADRKVWIAGLEWRDRSIEVH